MASSTTLPSEALRAPATSGASVAAKLDELLASVSPTSAPGGPGCATPARAKAKELRRAHSDSSLKSLDTDVPSLSDFSIYFGKKIDKRVTARRCPRNECLWHFVIHDMPEDSDFHEGLYHGVLDMTCADGFPHVAMRTPSGKLEVGSRIPTRYFAPSYTEPPPADVVIRGVLAHFLTSSQGRPPFARRAVRQVRRSLAISSWAFNMLDSDYALMFPDFVRADRAPLKFRKNPIVTVAARAVYGTEPCPQLADAAWAQLGSWSRVAYDARDQEWAERVNLYRPAFVDLGLSPSTCGTRHPVEVGEEQPECWICRQSSDEEPLINPCQCRGSMVGVHRSCVEDWIAHQRQWGVTEGVMEAPRCPVCKESYSGEIQRIPPQSAWKLWMQANGKRARCILQFAFSAFLVVAFILASNRQSSLPVWLRAAIVLLFALNGAHWAMVLFLSLPRDVAGAARPSSRSVRDVERARLPASRSGDGVANAQPPARDFFARWRWDDSERVDMVAFEAILAVVLTTLAFVVRVLPLDRYLPVLGVVSVIVLRARRAMMLHFRGFFFAAFAIAFSVAMSPVLLLFWLRKVLRETPREVFGLRGPMPHGFLICVVAPIMMAKCRSDQPLLALLFLHSGLALGVGTECFACSRVEWKDSYAWWFFVCVAYIETIGIVFMNHNGDVTYLYLVFYAFARSSSLTLTSALINYEDVQAAYRWSRDNLFPRRFELDTRSAGALVDIEMGGRAPQRPPPPMLPDLRAALILPEPVALPNWDTSSIGGSTWTAQSEESASS